jgi:hypothetical protein
VSTEWGFTLKILSIKWGGPKISVSILQGTVYKNPHKNPHKNPIKTINPIKTFFECKSNCKTEMNRTI